MSRRVLVIDDNRELTDNLCQVLSMAGAPLEITAASTAAEGLALAQKERFDVAIVDVKLPDGSGVDLVPRLLEVAPHAEVLLLTGRASVDTAIAAVRARAAAFLLKSAGPEEILTSVEQALSKVTLRREREALERRAASAEALNAMAPLALGLAHEIRNPLNAAVLELHLLGRGIDRLEDPVVRRPLRRRVEVVEGEIRRLERLLTEFLELARPRAPQREPVDLGQVVDEVLELEKETMAQRGVLLERDLPRGALILGDVEKLKQVVLNLVVNALDAMPSGGRLRASVAVEGERTLLCLKDSGKGIDPALVDAIFDPFFTTKPAGTGLGLAIVRKLVEQHGGQVALAPQSGAGTVARVTFPRHEPLAGEPPKRRAGAKRGRR